MLNRIRYSNLIGDVRYIIAMCLNVVSTKSANAWLEGTR